jgi:hypothetical protein
MGTRVYSYLCARPSLDVRNAIDEQLYVAHRYRLMLWHLASASRAQYRSRRREHFPELVTAEDESHRINAILGEVEKIEDRQEKREMRAVMRTHKIEMQRLRARIRELRALAKDSASLAADVAADREREGILQRALRNIHSRTYGLYSGTYLCVEDAARRARSGSRDPKRPCWDGARTRDFHAPRRLDDVHGSGMLGIQLQGGRSVAELLSGDDPSVQLVFPAGAHHRGMRAVCRYRLRSGAGGKPVLIDLPIAYHRELPRDAKVTWAKLAVTRSGLRSIYSLQLTVESAANERSQYGAGVVAVCLHNDRVMYSCEYGEPQEFVHDLRSGRGSELLSNRDKMRNNIIGLLTAWGERQDELPDWLRDELAVQEERPSARKLLRFVDRCGSQLPEKLLAEITKWRYRENHLFAWQSDMRTSALRRRQDAFRVFAATLRRKYRTLVLDSRRLDDPARMTSDRRDKGLHALRLALQHAFGDEVCLTTGLTCAELCERFRAAETPVVARNGETSSDSDNMEIDDHVRSVSISSVSGASA